MSIQLIRTSYEQNGVWGKLINQNGECIAITLEYAFPQGDTFISQLPSTSSYQCILNPIHLSFGQPFQTFFINGIPNNVGMKFGIGSSQTAGQILLGKERIGDQLIDSQCTFDDFMDDLIPSTFTFYLNVS